MPELPEVETVVRDLLDAGVVGRRIVATAVGWPRTLSGMSPAAFGRRLRGQRVTGISRRGKFIVVGVESDDTLLIHLRMTGRLYFRGSGAPLDTHEHVSLTLDDGRDLRFRDARKFGRWVLTTHPEDFLGRLGPEPLSAGLTGARFARMLERRGGMLKPLLLNQEFLAGLGNIYVDEALWEAGLHPRRRAATLAASDMRRLYRAVRTVLRRGVRSMGTSLGDGSANFYSVAGRRGRNQACLRVFRRTGLPCPRCGTPIRRLVVAQRGSHICPQCQRA